MLTKIKYKFREWISWRAFLSANGLPQGLKRGKWSLKPDEFEMIIKTIKENRSTEKITFVELGSGASTAIFGMMLSRLNKENEVISFEGDENWSRKTETTVNRFCGGSRVKVCYVPYKKSGNAAWFDEDKMKKYMKGRMIDILFVDAPHGKLCRHSRKPAIPFFIPYLKNNAVVFLHDTERQDEAETFAEWRKYFSESRNIGIGSGIAVFKGITKRVTPE